MSYHTNDGYGIIDIEREVIILKKILENYGFSNDAIKTLLAKKKYNAPYGTVELDGNTLITKRKATGEIKTEKLQ